jgi:hypothetical protein
MEFNLDDDDFDFDMDMFLDGESPKKIGGYEVCRGKKIQKTMRSKP